MPFPCVWVEGNDTSRAVFLVTLQDHQPVASNFSSWSLVLWPEVWGLGDDTTPLCSCAFGAGPKDHLMMWLYVNCVCKFKLEKPDQKCSRESWRMRSRSCLPGLAGQLHLYMLPPRWQKAQDSRGGCVLNLQSQLQWHKAWHVPVLQNCRRLSQSIATIQSFMSCALWSAQVCSGRNLTIAANTWTTVSRSLWHWSCGFCRLTLGEHTLEKSAGLRMDRHAAF